MNLSAVLVLIHRIQYVLRRKGFDLCTIISVDGPLSGFPIGIRLHDVMPILVPAPPEQGIILWRMPHFVKSPDRIRRAEDHLLTFGQIVNPFLVPER